MGVAVMTRTLHREMYMDFVDVPFYTEFTKVTLRKPDPDSNTVGLFVRPFKLDVWMSILAAIPLAVVALVLNTQAYGGKFLLVQKRSCLRSSCDALWFSCGALLQQGCTYKPNKLAVRIVVGSWWLFCTIIVATYVANLVAFLAVTQHTLPFTTLEQMTANTAYKFGTLGGTAWISFFKEASEPVYKNMWKSMVRNFERDADILSENHSLHLQKVEHERYAYIADLTSIQAEMVVNCHLTMLDLRFMSSHYCICLQNNSAYNDIISEELARFFASGLFERWRTKYWPKPAQCVSDDGPIELGLYHIQGPFYILFVLVMLSFLVFVTETVIPSVSHMKKNKQHGPIRQNENTQAEDQHQTKSWLTESRLCEQNVTVDRPDIRSGIEISTTET